MLHPRAAPSGIAFTNKIQTSWMCYNYNYIHTTQQQNNKYECCCVLSLLFVCSSMIFLSATTLALVCMMTGIVMYIFDTLLSIRKQIPRLTSATQQQQLTTCTQYEVFTTHSNQHSYKANLWPQ